MKKVIIIGSSSGIGMQLARVMSKDGYILGLTGSRLELLHKLESELSVESYIKYMDISNINEAMNSLNVLITEMGGVDLIIVSAGIGHVNDDLQWVLEQETINTNVLGVTAIINVAMQYFLNKKSGHLAVISSVASIRGSAECPAYNASKAYISNYIEGMRCKVFMCISACAQQGGSSVSQEESSTISSGISVASNSSEHRPQSENEPQSEDAPHINSAPSSDPHQDTTTISQVFERDGFTLDRIANIQLSINPDGSSVIVTTPEDIQAVWDTLSKLRITPEGGDQARVNAEKAIEVDIQFANPNHATHVVWYGPIIIHGREYYTFAEGFSEQALYDLIYEFIEPKPLSQYYQGLTQEQWNELQSQKENGRLSELYCPNFVHLWWEHSIDNYLIHHVGVNEFEAWLKEIDSIRNPDQCNIYSFSKYFSIALDELVSLIETNKLTHIYDVETVKRRYEYFNGSK